MTINKDKLQTIIDTLEANNSIDNLVEYFEKRVQYHKDQVRQAQVAIDRHEMTRDQHREYLAENEALADAFRTLKGE